MKPKLRWKKEPSETGLRAVGQAPRGYRYHDGEKQYATVSPLGGGWRPMLGWYWVAGWSSGVPHMNTCNNPVATPEEAKEQAEAYVTKFLADVKPANVPTPQ